MRRTTAKLIRKTAAATKTNYKGLKEAFKSLSQKDKHRARKEMQDAFDKKAAEQKGKV